MSRQLDIPGLSPIGDTSGKWRNVYTRIRSDGTRVSVALPPRRDAVVISAGAYRVYLEFAEAPRIADALQAAMEHIK